jgi:hypothetical protein
MNHLRHVMRLFPEHDTSSKSWDFCWDESESGHSVDNNNNYYFKGKEVSAAFAYPIPTGYETKLWDKFIVLVTMN